MIKKEAIIRGLKSFDYLLALMVIGISAFGVAMIYTSANHIGMPAREALAFGHLWRLQRMHVITGGILMFVFAAIDYRLITRAFLIIYGTMLVLLVATMLVGAGADTNVARWLPIPVPVIGFISLQPSEFAKVFMILFLAKFLEIKKDSFNRVGWILLIVPIIGVPFVLIVRQPSLSAALVVLFVSLVIMFAAGLKLRYIVIGAILGAIGVTLFWLDLQRNEPLFLDLIMHDYQIRRIRTQLNPVPGSDYFLQIENSIRAVAAGGLTGRGFGNNEIYLIFAHNDLIFSVAAEQFGFVGSVALIGVIMLMVIKCILIAIRAIDFQGRLIATGVAALLIFQTFVHVGVGTNMVPATGMPFPFMSYGGSKMWVHMIAVGIVLNVGLYRDKEEIDQEI